MFIQCSNLIARNGPAKHYGVAVADIDGDGQDEILVAGHGGPNLALKWDGSRLVDMAPPILADDGRKALSIACADLDGDGREEVYIQNTDSYAGPKQCVDRLLACFGQRWVDLFALPENFGVANRFSGRSVAVVDRKGMGRYGFVVTSYGGPMRLFELDGRGSLADMAEEAGLDAFTGGRSLLALPIVGALPDIFAGNETGPNLLYRNMGDGTFEEIGEAWGLGDDAQGARGAAALDADGDGLLDLVVANWNGPNRLFQQRPGGGFADIAPPELAQPGPARTVIAADFDNDGFEEIFINTHGGPNRLYGWRDERWTLIDIGDAAEPEGWGTGAAVADMDGDGQLELVIAHGERAAQPLSLYIAEPRGHHWLRVRPLTRAGAPARGALVKLWSAGRMQVRAVCAGSGYLCQMEPVAHFGLGQARSVDKVEVTWPDGETMRIDDPPLCRTMVVRYPG